MTATSAADRKMISAYVGGSREAFLGIDSWIRTELSDRFSVLAQDAQDICQMVHQKLLVNFRGDRFRYRSTLKTYVVRICRYTAVDLIRKRYRDWIVEGEEPRPAARIRTGPYRALFHLEKRHLLRQILLLAPPTCRQLWRLAYVEMLAYTEIARRLAIPPGTVKSRMWYCRRKAIALMKELRMATRSGSGSRQG